MKFLHISDLHLGRRFNGLPLDADHAAVLDQVIDALTRHRPDALLIAGDIYDKSQPPASAVEMLNGFLRRVVATGTPVALIAGNHDSPDRIEIMATLADPERSLIRGVAATMEAPLLLSDRYGVVAISGLPFAYEKATAEIFGDPTIRTPQDVLTAQMEAARAQLPSDARWVVLAHGFVAGGSIGDSERSLSVGGVETVSPETFDGAHYVALGHLHRPQTAGAPHIRYSGAPLAFGFDEAGQQKGMLLVEMAGDGAVTVEELPITPLRRVRVLQGRFDEVIRATPSQDFIKIILEDRDPVLDPMKRLREIFPNACELSYVRRSRDGGASPLQAATARVADPMAMIGDFLTDIREAETTEAESELIARTLADLHRTESTA